MEAESTVMRERQSAHDTEVDQEHIYIDDAEIMATFLHWSPLGHHIHTGTPYSGYCHVSKGGHSTSTTPLRPPSENCAWLAQRPWTPVGLDSEGIMRYVCNHCPHPKCVPMNSLNVHHCHTPPPSGVPWCSSLSGTSSKRQVMRERRHNLFRTRDPDPYFSSEFQKLSLSGAAVRSRST